LRLRRLDRTAIQVQEHGHGHEPDPLVPIRIPMAAGQTEPIRLRHFRNLPGLFIRPLIDRPRQRGFDISLIADSDKSTKTFQLLEMQRVHPLSPEPERLLHFASSRKAFWYCLLTRASASITRRK